MSLYALRTSDDYLSDQSNNLTCLILREDADKHVQFGKPLKQIRQYLELTGC